MMAGLEPATLGLQTNILTTRPPATLQNRPTSLRWIQPPKIDGINRNLVTQIHLMSMQ